MSSETHKLYCYIDETGQDTFGAFFIVAIVVTDGQQHELERSLETIEQLTGKKTKWMKTRDRVRVAYVDALVKRDVPAMIFVKNFMSSSKNNFDDLEVLAAAQAINSYREAHSIREDEYKLTITVDGLSKTVAARMASEFRKLGIKPRKIVGKKDESSAIIRLADAIAGLSREAYEGRQEYKQLATKLKRAKTLYEL
jgi:hypothetical protein